MKLLRNSLVESLSQIDALLLALEVEPAGKQNLYEESGIGKHVRHVIDHFLVLKSGLDSGLVDYNTRTRDSETERNPALARKMIRELSHWVSESLKEDKVLEIVSEISCQQTSNVMLSSNLRREMHYISYHTIHHVAYCALLAKQQGISIDPAIGLAPATVTYLRTAEAR
ncbi:MAG: hypothetical protein RQ899_08150 [Pseudomonadales bacterium]|nr:hypothetical protein [Pseudomonadales bacterium]